MDPAVPSDGPGVSGRLRALRGLDGLPEAYDAWVAPPTPDEALDELIGAAARVLAARTDAPIAFCHAVTAPAAVRLVLPLLSPDQQRASVAASWQVVGGIVAAFADPRMDAEALAAEADPEVLLAELNGRADRARGRARDQADRGGRARVRPIRGRDTAGGRRPIPRSCSSRLSRPAARSAED